MNVVIITHHCCRFLNISVIGSYYKVNGDALTVTWSGQGLTEENPGEAEVALFVCSTTANATDDDGSLVECYSNPDCTMAGDRYEHATGRASIDSTNAAYPSTEGEFAFCIMDAQVVEFLKDSCFHFFYGYGYYGGGGGEDGGQLDGGDNDDASTADDKDCNATLTFDYSAPFRIDAPILLTTPSQGECIASGDAPFAWQSEVVDDVRVSICTALSNTTCATNPACTLVGYGTTGGIDGGNSETEGRGNATLNVRSHISNINLAIS